MKICPKCGEKIYIEAEDLGRCPICGTELEIRDDDKVETIKNRLNVFHNAAGPLIDYFIRKNVLHKVNGMISLEEVSRQIAKILE